MNERKGVPAWPIVLLVSIGLVVLMVSVLGILAVAGVRKYINASKTAEAVNSVTTMALSANRAFESDHKLCESASSPVPASMSMVAAKKYMSTPADWDADRTKHAGFACIDFSMSFPQYYQYDYKKTGAGSFSAIAHGDLDGNGVTSEFSQSGRVVGGAITLDTLVRKNESE